MTADEHRWGVVLDELEARLADGGDFTPPVDLPPLPASLRDRAAGLLAAQATAIDALGRRRDAVAGELSALRGAGRRATSAPTASTAGVYDRRI